MSILSIFDMIIKKGGVFRLDNHTVRFFDMLFK